MNVQPVRLEGPSLILDPLTPEHASALWPKTDPDLFLHTLEWPRDDSAVAFADWVRDSLTKPASLHFVILVKPELEAVGMTGYLDIRPPHRGLEIGRTWIAKSHQGTKVNPESKYLLLRHAFEELGAARVQFKTDVHNLQSQRALEKLGAQREGVLRRFQMRSNGFIRDTMIFSLIAEEWPQVKAGLERRLGFTP
ncbi:MAG TPA: GNAT family protein [Thermoanaerobaculia bacterium]|jgi:ribosomal-protein-alanine N-acetyltransferase|nr:GNAT family protein [Thermoanaerobaculia bacterium]